MNHQIDKSLAPFACQYSPQFPELLHKLNFTLVISTYQAGKLVFISAKDENSLIQLPRHFEKAMGIAESKNQELLALACKDEVTLFRCSNDLAIHYPKSPNKYDSMYLPQASFYTGGIDIHDLNFDNENNLFAVNTLFSCIVKIESDYSFKSIWQPKFISELKPEDRCHLNGMAFQDGKAKYATAFNEGNSRQSWRENLTKTGVLIDVETNEIVTKGLAMPK